MVLRNVLVVGVTAAVVATGAAPAAAGGETPRSKAGHGRFTQVDTTGLKKIVGRPLGLAADREVSALVQLSGDPVAVQQRKAAAARSRFDAVAAERSLLGRQAGSEAALRSAGASVQGRLTHVLNAVRIRVKAGNLAKVAAVPGVTKVQVSGTVRRANAAAGLFTGVDKAWGQLGLTGKGVKVGVIDTGIDYTHADFGGPGTVAAFTGNDGTVIEKGSFPTAKVVGGFDFVGDDYNADDPATSTPLPDPDPLDCNGHGTHVAGTAAGLGVLPNGKTYPGPYSGPTLKRAFTVAPGAAPQASLYAYRVFGCDGSVNNDVIIAALDQAVADGVDVVNMSLGATFGTSGELDSLAVDVATQAGTLVVISAGNEGPNAYMVGSPGTAASALTVAAVDASSPTFGAVAVTGAATGKGINANGVAVTAAITGQLVDVGLGCDAADYAGVAGKIALATRGVCARVDRATFGQQAGALAVIMINNADGLPPFEGVIPGVTIPFVGIDGRDGAAFLAADGGTVTLADGGTIPNEGYTKFAPFSSNGPTRLTNEQKPDVSAPGVSLLSANVGSGNGGINESGTSMAAPHTAGVAALVAQAHPGWSPQQLKAAVMSTGDATKIGDYDSRRGGTGLVQPRRAADTVGYAWTADGRNTLNYGYRALTGAFDGTRSFQITNVSGTARTYDLSTELSSTSHGAQVTVSPATVTVAPGGTAKVSVRVRLSAAAVAALPSAADSDFGALDTLHGVVVATPRGTGAGVYRLRTPFLLVPQGESQVKATLGPLTATGANTLSGRISLANSGIHAGTADVYTWLSSDRVGDSPDPAVPDVIDLGAQSIPGPAVGLPASDRLMVFAVSSAKGTSTQSANEYDVLIDVNRDGTTDFTVIGADLGLVLAGVPSGDYGAVTVDAEGNLVDAWNASAPMNGSTVELPVTASLLGLQVGRSRFAASVVSGSILGVPGADSTGSAIYDSHAPVTTNAQFAEVPAGGSASVGVRVVKGQLTRTTAKGWLVVSVDDPAGRAEADRVPLPPL